MQPFKNSKIISALMCFVLPIAFSSCTNENTMMDADYYEEKFEIVVQYHEQSYSYLVENVDENAMDTDVIFRSHVATNHISIWDNEQLTNIIDIKDLIKDDANFWRNMRYLFGEPEIITTEQSPIRYHFYNGLYVDSYSEFINFVIVDFTQLLGEIGFHFDGMDNMATSNSVEKAFGRGGSSWVTWEHGATNDERYKLFFHEHDFAKFVFDKNERVIRIHVFVPHTPQELSEKNSIDIQFLVGRELDDLRSLFGRQVGYAPHNLGPVHVFENGLIIGAAETIMSILIDYERMENRYSFNFNGIDGKTTREGVLAILGEPYWMIEDEGRYEFGYHAAKYGQFVRFRFCENDYVASISFFIPA